jgi:hypothetical protein
MRRIIVIALSGITLSGCTPFSVPGFGFLTPSPPAATLQLESMPPGAEARTSAGPSCRTPCSVSVATEPLTVTFTLDWHEPQTVAVQPIQQTIVNPNVDAVGSTVVMELDPNPVFAELAPMAPPKRTAKRPPPKRVAAKRPPADAPPPPASSPFPPPSAPNPVPSR